MINNEYDWHNEKNVKEYVKWLKKYLDIKSKNEWYEISTDMIKANYGERCLFQTGEDKPSRNIYDILSLTYPNIHWKEELFGEISKEQKRLFRLLKRIYPNEKLLFNRRYPWLKNPKTGYWLELDFYFPDLAFAIEHQGRQHFIHKENFLMSKKEFVELQERDKLKLKICRQEKIKLVYTTHDWNGRINSLKKDIKRIQCLQLIGFRLTQK